MRRAIRYGSRLGLNQLFFHEVCGEVVNHLGSVYTELQSAASLIQKVVMLEEETFRKTLDRGLTLFQESSAHLTRGQKLDGGLVFKLYETYGFPLELIFDELGLSEDEMKQIEEDFKVEESKHREESRAGAEQKFKGGLADQSRETTKLHTAHHLLLAALQKLIDPNIRQRGSNITGERLRIDFNLDRKLTDAEVIEVEDLVNRTIEAALPVERKEMPKSEAESIGAQMEFGQKYPEIVSVYFIGEKTKEEPKSNDTMTNNDEVLFSAEFCGGPHVSNTSELGENGKKFKILKQESSGAGIRRIKAALI